MKWVMMLAALAMSTAPSRPAWTIPVDSRTQAQWLSQSPGYAYTLQDAHPIAIDATTGARLWSGSTIRATHAPAFAAGVLAVPTSEGVELLDPKTGHVRSTIAGVVNAIAGSASFIVTHTSDFRGYDGAGNLRWRRSFGAFPFAEMVTLRGNLIGIQSNDELLLIDASNGRAVADVTDVSEIIGFDGRFLWCTVADGGLKGVDLETSRSIAIHDRIVRGQARAEHGRAVAVVDGRLTLIDLRDGTTSRLAIYGRWIGGPVFGKILVERSDGLYVQAIAPHGRAIRVTQYRSAAKFATSDRKVAYVGLVDGTMLVIDLVHDRLATRYATGCDFYEGVTASGRMTLVHCDRGAAVQLVGFSRLLL